MLLGLHLLIVNPSNILVDVLNNLLLGSSVDYFKTFIKYLGQSVD